MSYSAVAAACMLSLILAGSCTASESSQQDSHARALKVYEGCSAGSWGSVCTVDNHNGTSTTCTKGPYYNGCDTYPNGRKLLSAKDESEDLNVANHGRGLRAYEGCSSGGWGSVCTTDNHDGTSTTCTKGPYYNGCETFPNGDRPGGSSGPSPSAGPPSAGRRMLGQSRGLKAYEGCSSGSWGSVCTTDNHNGTSTTCTKGQYYNGCETYPNGNTGRKLMSAVAELMTAHVQGLYTSNQGRALKAYEGCSGGSWGSVCTTDNHNGTSTTCTTGRYYNGCSTYPNGESGRKLLTVNEGTSAGHGRALKVNEGCSSGHWGSICTKDNRDGTATTCTNTKYYSGCSSYPGL